MRLGREGGGLGALGVEAADGHWQVGVGAWGPGDLCGTARWRTSARGGWSLSWDEGGSHLAGPCLAWASEWSPHRGLSTSV